MGNNYHAATPLLMRVEDAHEGRALLFVFFMLVFVCLLHANTGFAATPKSRIATVSQSAQRLSARKTAMVNSLLLQAQQAHTRGDTEKVKSLLLQARRIDPKLITPSWLKKTSPSASTRKPDWSLEQLIEKLGNEPGGRNLLRLVEYVRRNPQDLTARELLIQEAIDAGATPVLQHINATDTLNLQTDTPNWLRVVKWLVVYVLFLLTAWQVLLIEKDLRTSRK